MPKITVDYCSKYSSFDGSPVTVVFFLIDIGCHILDRHTGDHMLRRLPAKQGYHI